MVGGDRVGEAKERVRDRGQGLEEASVYSVSCSGRVSLRYVVRLCAAWFDREVKELGGKKTNTGCSGRDV